TIVKPFQKAAWIYLIAFLTFLYYLITRRRREARGQSGTGSGSANTGAGAEIKAQAAEENLEPAAVARVPVAINAPQLAFGGAQVFAGFLNPRFSFPAAAVNF